MVLMQPDVYKRQEVDNVKDVLAKAIANLQTVKAPVNNGCLLYTSRCV